MNDAIVEINTSNNPLYVIDFAAGGGHAIATGGAPITLDAGNRIISATVGKATASVAGIVSLSGGFTVQKQTVDGVNFHAVGLDVDMPAEVLVVAGKDVNAFAGINGPYRRDTNGDGIIDASDTPSQDAIGFAIDDLDFALVMLTPTPGAGITLPGKFYAFTASAGLAGLVGTDPYLTLQATDVKLGFNGAFLGKYPVPSAYVDFSKLPGGGLSIPIGSDPNAFKVDFDSNSLRIAMTATLGLFNLFKISTSFDFDFELPSTGQLIPTISLSKLTSFLPDKLPGF
ncbi:MAG: hypothetical protein JF617_18910, partial [Burkholderiales bacterium]|nr:hypothetical protein [Burkholderiales bacterium]